MSSRTRDPRGKHPSPNSSATANANATKTTNPISARSASLPAPPPAAPTANTVDKSKSSTRLMAKEHAIKELADRKLISDFENPSLDTLISILIAFTGKEATGQNDFDEVSDVPNAVGSLLRYALGRLVAEATADATIHRYESIAKQMKEKAETELKEERVKLEERQEVLSASEDALMQKKRELEGERGRFVEEKRKHELERTALEGILDGMRGALRRLEAERGQWEKLRESREEPTMAQRKLILPQSAPERSGEEEHVKLSPLIRSAPERSGAPVKCSGDLRSTSLVLRRPLEHQYNTPETMCWDPEFHVARGWCFGGQATKSRDFLYIAAVRGGRRELTDGVCQ